MTDNNKKIMCPSSKAKNGGQLLGVRQDDGTIAILPQTLPVDDDFVDKASADGLHAEQKFRFTNKCVESGCKQWNGKSCGVIEQVVGFIDQLPITGAIADCPIRKSCRWFLQRGEDACKVCPFVVTEVTQEDEVLI